MTCENKFEVDKAENRGGQKPLDYIINNHEFYLDINITLKSQPSATTRC